MSKTYQFVRTRQQAVDNFKALFFGLPVEWVDKKTINSGYGEKLIGKYQDSDFSAVIYFNKNNYSSKIVLEKGSQQIEQLLAAKLGQAKASSSAGVQKNQQNQGLTADAQGITKKDKIEELEGSKVPDLLISESHIGTDESGKGDYFGPLVIAGFFMEKQDVPLLREIGVADSKKISDKKIKVMAEKLREFFKDKYNLVYIYPEKYNALYAKMTNLNKLLAWGHARVMENLLHMVNCEYIITDKFGDDSYIQQALMQKGRQIKLIQTPRAEQDLAVAAASVLARDVFLTKLQEMSEKYGVTIPKGCNERVKNVGKQILAEYGREQIGKIAKLHFKTTQEIIDNL